MRRLTVLILTFAMCLSLLRITISADYADGPENTVQTDTDINIDIVEYDGECSASENAEVQHDPIDGFNEFDEAVDNCIDPPQEDVITQDEGADAFADAAGNYIDPPQEDVITQDESPDASDDTAEDLLDQAAEETITPNEDTCVNRYSVYAPWLTSPEFVFQGTDYCFTTPETGSTVRVTVNSVPVEPAFSEESQNYTISGADITGDIIIIYSRFAVTLPEGFSGEPYAEAGKTYTFTLDRKDEEANEVYAVSAAMSGCDTEVSYDAELETYYVENVTGTLYITAAPAEKKQFNVSILDTDGNSEKMFTGDTTVPEGEAYSFSFSETPEDHFCYCYAFEVFLNDETSGAQALAVRQLDDTVFEVIDAETGTPAAITGDLEIVYTGRENKAFHIAADRSDAGKAWDTLCFPTNEDGETLSAVYGQEEPYTVLIMHEEDRRTQQEDTEEDRIGSAYLYFMPTLKIQAQDGSWQDYFGYSLETVTDDSEYIKLWKLCIPGSDIKGDIMLFADKTEKSTPDGAAVPVITVSFFNGSNDTDKIEGLSVFSAEMPDAADTNARDYFFSLKRDSEVERIKYSVNGSEPREPELAGEYIYKIPAAELTGDITVTIGEPVIYSVTGQGEAYIDLPSDTAVANQAYSFNVLCGSSLFSDLMVSVTIGEKTYILGDSTEPNTPEVTDHGDFISVTIPASMVVNDILIAVEHNSPVQYNVIFEDAYYEADRYLNYRFTAFKIVLVSENNGEISRSLLDNYMDPYTRSIIIDVPAHEKLQFEVVLPKVNAYGKYYTDPNTDCYIYDFTGSTMNGAVTCMDTLNSEERMDADGTFHVDYYIDDVSGDAVIKVKPVMKKFNVIKNGSGAAGISLKKTTASYRSNLAFGKSDNIIVDSILIGGQKAGLNAGYRYAVDSNGASNTNSFIIDGTYITGDIVINATQTANDEAPAVNISTTMESDTGNEYSLSMSEFKYIDNGNRLRLVTAKGEPGDDMKPCYDGHEMVYFEPYNAWVWLTVSNEETDTAYNGIADCFAELSEKDIQTIRQSRVMSGLSTEAEEYAIMQAIEKYVFAGDLNGDFTVNEKDVSLARDLYMETDIAAINASPGLFLLADVNRSGALNMKDVAGIKRLTGNYSEEEKERSFSLELSKDKEHSAEDEIKVELKLVRTDTDPDDDAAVSVIQDRICYDGNVLELLEQAELADGVETGTVQLPSDEPEENRRCISLSYVAPENSEFLKKETVLATFTFRFEATGNDIHTELAQEDALVTGSDCKTDYPCTVTSLRLPLEKNRTAVYTVTFNYMGVGEDRIVKAENGSRINAPEIIPEYPGHVLFSWHTDAKCTEENVWNFDEDTVNGDMTLYAKWNALPATKPDESEPAVPVAVAAASVTVCIGVMVFGVGIYRKRKSDQ